MITTRMAAAYAAALAVGILAGSAGTIVLREATSPSPGDQASWRAAGSMMAGGYGMMSGAGMMGGRYPMGPASGMLDWMQGRHPAVSPVPAQ